MARGRARGPSGYGLSSGLMVGGAVRTLRSRLAERRLAGPRILREFAGAYPRARFLQIGASDGMTFDPIREHVLHGEWTGVLVEPVPYVFDRLVEGYSGVDRVAFENVAIADRDDVRPFFHFADVDRLPEGVPEWYPVLGSFSREMLERAIERIPALEPMLVETRVECMTLETLRRKHGIDDLDLVVVDVEGHDHEVVAQLDLEAVRPRLLVYEEEHLPPGEAERSRRRVEAAGYATLAESPDRWCLDTAADDGLSVRWRRLLRRRKG